MSRWPEASAGCFFNAITHKKTFCITAEGFFYAADWLS